MHWEQQIEIHFSAIGQTQCRCSIIESRQIAQRVYLPRNHRRIILFSASWTDEHEPNSALPDCTALWIFRFPWLVQFIQRRSLRYKRGCICLWVIQSKNLSFKHIIEKNPAFAFFRCKRTIYTNLSVLCSIFMFWILNFESV